MNRTSTRTSKETQRGSSEEGHDRSQNRTATGTQEAERRGAGGRGWHGDPVGHAAAGSKGGQKVSQNREHMARIGRKGGQAVSRDREHMAEIGRKGGQSRGDNGSDQRDNNNK